MLCDPWLQLGRRTPMSLCPQVQRWTPTSRIRTAYSPAVFCTAPGGAMHRLWHLHDCVPTRCECKSCKDTDSLREGLLHVRGYVFRKHFLLCEFVLRFWVVWLFLQCWYPKLCAWYIHMCAYMCLCVMNICIYIHSTYGNKLYDKQNTWGILKTYYICNIWLHM